MRRRLVKKEMLKEYSMNALLKMMMRHNQQRLKGRFFFGTAVRSPVGTVPDNRPSKDVDLTELQIRIASGLLRSESFSGTGKTMTKGK